MTPQPYLSLTFDEYGTFKMLLEEVDGHADPHLEGVAFCKPVVLH